MDRTSLITALMAVSLLLPAAAADRSGDKAVGSTALRPAAPLDSHAMNAMLRADRDKDGTLSLEELQRYDMGLARGFKDVDTDRDGKLTFYEFEKLLQPAEISVNRR